MAFPNFFGKQYESASNFLDDLEMAFLVSGRDEEEVKLRAFPLVLKDSAKNWFQNLEPGRKTNWETLKETFLSKYGGLDNPEHLWHRISSLHQATSRTYLTYESQFLRLWAEWEASLAEGERARNFLKKEKFLAGLFPDLQEKVKGKFPETFEEALQIARVKDRKLEYQAHTSRVEHPQGPTMADERLPPAPTTTPEDPHLELLQRVTNQLDNLSINMVQGVRQQQPQPNNERMPNGPRRQPQRRDYSCYTCGEEGHEKEEQLEALKAIIEELYPGYTIVSIQEGPKISWTQLLYLSPKVRRQWSKMVSTRRVKTKAMGLVSRRSLKGIKTVVDAYVKVQRISNVYVDGGAQICVMSEHVFHRLGLLKISAPAPYKAKMANNVKVKCLGIVNGVKVRVCEVEIEVDVYVMPNKGEGYPIIFGRPWLMAMHARQDWGSRMLELSPRKGSGKKTKVVHYDMKTGKQGKIKFETSADEFSSSIYSTTIEEESTTSDESDSSGEVVMGIILTEANKVDP
ncbi:hypothetical protein L7F22_023489 [Adiantum nelumboides]|nr:hypothetical protein [Adiantum nelumboides]